MNPSGLKVTGAWFQVGGNLIATIGTTEDLLEKRKLNRILLL